MKCPVCAEKEKVEIIGSYRNCDFERVVEFYCWVCETVYINTFEIEHADDDHD